MGLAEKTALYVIDDDPDLCELVATLLSEEGYETRAFTNVEEARRDMRVVAPALVLLDLTLRETSGAEFCRELKADSRTAEVPVILLSGQCHLDFEMSQAGADACLCKPFELEDVLRYVAAQLSRPRRNPLQSSREAGAP